MANSIAEYLNTSNFSLTNFPVFNEHHRQINATHCFISIFNMSEDLFKAIKANDKETVRQLIQNKSLLTTKKKFTDISYPSDVANDGYKFLGAFIGSVTPLHLAMLLHFDAIAADIIDNSFAEHLDESFGQGNTALHLAALLGTDELIQKLLNAGASPVIKNHKGNNIINLGFLPVDVVDDADIRQLFANKQ